MSKNNRRDFLKHLFLSSPYCVNALRMGPLSIFFEAIIKKAYGIQDDTNGNVMNYIGIMMTGGPPRWYFDLPLRPNGNIDSFQENPMVASQIVDNKLKYQQMRFGNYYMPMMWDRYIPQVSGGRIKMSTMLQNMIMFRGYSLGVDGHGGNQVRHFRPIVGGSSIDGELGSKSLRPIPNVACGTSFGFSSPTGSSQVSVSLGDRDPLSTLMSNFRMSGNRTPLTIKDAEIEMAFDQVLQSIEALAHKNNTPLKNTYANRINAKKVFKEQFGNLKDWYNLRFTQYRDLEMSCYTDSTYTLGSGIQNHSFYNLKASDGLPDLYYNIAGIKQRATNLPDWGVNLENAFNSSTTVSSMAHTLTIAEFLIQNKLSSAMTLQWGGIRNLQIGSRNIGFGNDGHSNGTLASLMFYSKMYQAIATGLNEFKTFLEGIGEFDKTVIQLSGDFNRNPNSNSGGGSGHGWSGSNTTVLSGMVKNHMIIGNCTTDSRGSWGKAAPMDFLEGATMGFGHVASSITTMLECNSPTPNNPSLVNKDSSGIVTAVSGVGAKNV